MLWTVSPVLLLLSLTGATAQGLPPIRGVNIPLTLDSNKRYVVDVNMSSGPNTQRFGFALIGNTGLNGVAGISCGSCNDVRQYNASASISSTPLPGSRSIQIGGASASGGLVKEDCALSQDTGAAWQYPNQTVVLVNSSSSLFSGGTSGFLGLGTSAGGQTGNFNDTIYGNWLVRNPGRSNFSFGMALNKPDGGDGGDGGVLHWLTPDPSAFLGDVSFRSAQVSANALNAAAGSDSGSDSLPSLVPESDWMVEMDAWAATSGSAAVTNATGGQRALIEPWFPEVYFPFSQAELFYSLLPQAQLLTDFVDGARVWSLPCDSEFTLTLTFEQKFAVGESDLVVKRDDGTCIGSIQAWADPRIDFFLIGSRFISSLYLIFQIGRPGSDIPTLLGFAQRNKPGSSTNVGAIVGGTVGGVLFVIFLGVAFYVFRRRRNFRRMQLAKAASARSSMQEKDPHGVDEDGSQYVLHHQRPHSGVSGVSAGWSARGSYASPPTSAFSTGSHHPLLPEPQSPATQYRDVPGTPSLVVPGNAPNMISPTDSMQSGSHLRMTFTPSTEGQDFGIEPFVLPGPAPHTAASSQRDSKVAMHLQWNASGPRYSGQSDTHPQSQAQTNSLPIESSVSSGSTAGTVEPFTYPTQSSGAAGSKAAMAGVAPIRRLDTPAPPYTAALEPVQDEPEPGTGTGLSGGQTLVDYSPSTQR